MAFTQLVGYVNNRHVFQYFVGYFIVGCVILLQAKFCTTTS